MKKHRIPSGHFARGFEKLAQKANKSVRDFLGQPNEENTHALRGAIRRLETSISILPRDVRKEKSLKEYRFRCGRVFKSTSKIRNLDILESKLILKKSDNGILGMRERIKKERQKSVGRSTKAAWKLIELRIPRVDEKELAGSARNTRRVLNDLDTVIWRELSVVTSDEMEVEKLHSLRKHCKRFRYALELIPEDAFKPDVLELLERWQDELGMIRDSDIMIRYLESSGDSRATKPLLAAERVARHRRYLAFVRSYSRASEGTRMSLVAKAGLN